MKFTKFTFLVLLALVLTHCAPVKLVDTSFEIEGNSLKSKPMLVIARSEDMDVRKAYEDALVKKIKARGFEAKTGYLEFPELKENKDRTEEETQALIAELKAKGIKSVLVAALRNVKTLRPESDRGEATPQTTVQKGQYGVSFAEYYNVNSVSFLSSSMKPLDREQEPITEESFLESTVYSLEAVVYDLTKPQGQQLAGVYEVEATDPKSAAQVLEKFSTLVSKELD